MLIVGMDLSSAHDHPSNIIVRATDSTSRTATLLHEYEQEHDVTFAALDNDTLAEVQRLVYVMGVTPFDSGPYVTAARELREAVVAMIGETDPVG